MISVLNQVQALLGRREVAGYLTGGFVRDVLMGRECGDVDIVVGAPALELAPDISNALGGKFVPLDEAHEVARVVLAGDSSLHLDLTTMRGDIAQDLALRDFTIDAMAIDIKQFGSANPPLIDLFNGRRDLEDGVVRSISEEAFRSDPARLLRATRLAAECGFVLDDETAAQIKRNHRLIATVAAERVRDELCRTLAAPGAARWLRLLDDLGLLMTIIPEFSATRGTEQPKEHYWDVFQHSIETVAAVEFLLRIRGSEHFGDDIAALAPWTPQLAGHFDEEVGGGHDRKTLLKLVALLHDIAKPQTKVFEETGRMRFFDHAPQGADMVRDILKRLRFSAREQEIVASMIQHHLRPGQMARDGEIPTHRAIYRYFRDCDDVGIDTIFLNLADHLAARGPALEFEKWREHVEVMAYVLEERLRDESVVSPPKLISGHDIMAAFGMAPGPHLGRVLEAVREAQAAGEVATREEALSFASSFIDETGPKA